MKKTMYIPKWQESRFSNLTCERIVVNGTLYVDGKLSTKHISGNGFIFAKWITATSITVNIVDADSIATDTLAAAHINAFDIHAVQSIEVSTLVTANYVKTGRMIYADSEIRDLQADEVIKLAPKRRGLLRTLFASFVRSKWTELTQRDRQKKANCDFDNVETTGPSVQDISSPENANPVELEEAARLLDDPEFLRLKALYKLTQETGYIWQITPKTTPTDRAVTAFTAA